MTTISREFRVQVAQTRVRATPEPAARQFRDALGATGLGVLEAVEQAAGFVPGGASVAAAVRGAADSGTSGGGSTSTTTGGSTDLRGAMTAQSNQAMELLELQQQMAVEQRQFQTLSNVMKARHDTAKSVIQNVR